MQQRTPQSQRVIDVLQRANRIAEGTELDDLLNQMMDLIIDVTGAEAGTFYLYDPGTDELIFKVVKGDPGSMQLLGTRVPAGAGIAGAALRSGQPEYIPDVLSDPRWYRRLGELSDRRLRTMYCLPLLVKSEPVGIVQVFNLPAHTVDDAEELALLQLLGNRMVSEVQKAVLLARTQQREARLQALISIISHISSTLDRDELLDMIMNNARELLDAEATSIWIKDERSGDLQLHIATGERSEATRGMRVPAGQGIIGQVVSSGEMICVDDVRKDSRHYAGVDQQSGFVTRSILCVPLRAPGIALGGDRGMLKETIIGGVQALNKRNNASFSSDDIELLGTLTSQAATVWRISQLYNDTDRLFNGIVEMVTGAIDLKDPYTRGHSQRVSEFSLAIGRQLGLSPETLHHIRIGGLMHDLGKIGVDDAVLRKEGSLTDEEFAQMKMHPTNGSRMVYERQLDWLLREELLAMAEHHERLDGKGYPKGLHGDEISQIGRIVAVADVFDAITSDRPYRKGRSAEEALEILGKNAGSHFDVLCVRALIQARQNGEVLTQHERPDYTG